MRKKILIYALLLLLIPTFVLADTDVHDISIDEVLQKILENQNISTVDELNCEYVTDDEWELLGESVMGIMHPDPEVHDQMDNMMGGEGSESLRIAHIRMGQNYLGCGTGYGMMGFGMGMMGGGMIAPLNKGFSGKGSMMSGMVNSMGISRYPFLFTRFGAGSMVIAWLFMIGFWIIVFAALVWLFKQIKK
jgi:hypothetical protein